MLMPKFSVRWLLVLTAVCAGISLIIAAAVKGQGWARAFALGLGGAGLMVAAHGIVYLLARVFTIIPGRMEGPSGRLTATDSQSSSSTESH